MTTLGWLNPYDYPINKIVEENFEYFRDEAVRLYNEGKFTPHLQSGENQKSGNNKLAEKWDKFDLFRGGKLEPSAEIDAPFAVNFFRKFPQITGQTEGLVYYSCIPAGGVVKPHTFHFGQKIGVRVRNQLALVLPELNDGDEVYFDILGERRSWELGKVMTFDDSYLHHVKNLSSGHRIVLLYDIIGPRYNEFVNNRR